MTRSERKYVLAWTHAQALHYARMMEWSRDEWAFIGPGDEEKLLGLHSIVLYDVRAPRFHPTQTMAEKMQRTRERIQPMLDSERISKLNVVNLP